MSLPSTVGSVAGTKWICFDIGGVLVEVRRNWQDACTALQLRQHLPVLSPVQESQLRDLAAQFHLGQIDINNFFVAKSEILQAKLSAEQLRSVYDAIIQNENPDGKTALSICESLGLNTAVLSNSNPFHWSRVSQFPVISRFAADVSFLSHVTGLMKPALPAFLNVADTLRVPPSSLLLLDDCSVNVKAARNAGWQAVLVPTPDSLLRVLTSALSRNTRT